MQVNLAESAGFCAGVRLAVKKALDAANRYPNQVYMLGDIVHNEVVIKKLDEAGVKVVEDLNDIPAGGVILIRAHGASPDVFAKAKKRGLKVIDATCPMVLDIHKEARELEREGFLIVVIGDKGHDEVEGISSQVKKSYIVSSTSDVKNIPLRQEKIGIVVQSTQSLVAVKEILGELSENFSKIFFVNTICEPTKKRQREIRELPLKNDTVIVIGSSKRANTKRLVDISKNINPKTYRVLDEKELKKGWFEGVRKVGVTAGASTPKEVITRVVGKLKGF